MLRELHISGLGVIDDLDLELHPGCNVLTGETGAGKTMVTVGLSLALGQRGSASLVRPGAVAARVQARFERALPASAADWIDDDQLVLARTVGADGKSTVRVGGQIATVSSLAALAPDLVEVHGQHRTQRLLHPSAQAAFLDRFEGATHLETVSDYQSAHARLVRCRGRLDELELASREREREIDLLGYQVREIEEASVRTGELAQLAAEEARLGHAERLAELATAAGRALAEEDAGVDVLRTVFARLNEAATLDPDLAELAARASALAAEAADLAGESRSYAESLQPDPDRLDELRRRQRTIQELHRKYGRDEEEVLEFLDRARSRLRRLETADDERRELEGRLDGLVVETARLAELVTQGRRRAAPRLAGALDAELAELGMAGAHVEVGIHPLSATTSGGAERVELLFAAGEAQALLPLAKTASGGELSRVMLACRSVLADLDQVPTVVFDEVDAGIGGRAGVAVGRRLSRIAQSRQVLVVTHLPQIAAFADRHVRVLKTGDVASVSVVTDDERVSELARMLSGAPGSASAAAHAEELLTEAGRIRRGDAQRSSRASRSRRREPARD